MDNCKHKWIEKDIKEPNFQVVLGKTRKCELCGLKQVYDYTKNRASIDTWRTVKESTND